MNPKGEKKYLATKKNSIEKAYSKEDFSKIPEQEKKIKKEFSLEEEKKPELSEVALPSESEEFPELPEKKDSSQFSQTGLGEAPGIENLIKYALRGGEEEKEAIAKAKKIFENEPFLIDRFHDLLLEEKQKGK